ncbi:murein L,D-transpeptidase catalytic domain family protein [uncultured Pseudomonas sp.]|uniref:murein L,D-transpeptidase catalytic domain family protein n=1 Tax=uncultured Pseudomonas sp. TaxID=114707 RepID=UPI0025F6CCB2|nr:murein L,D-transpeptidase catalytic domain family protein [uncultured Pseudomonas sp.]
MLKTIRGICLALACLALPAQAAFAARPTSDPLLQKLGNQAPGLERQVLAYALAAMHCAINNGAAPAERLAIIDFSLASSERRLWIFDLKSKRLLLNDLVAHGQQSGDNFATRFSNLEGSHQSSIGLFRTEESYTGKHGYSLRMDGLEPGFNDQARQRAIVIHPADYVNPAWIQTQGRIGRSQGCPAVRPEVARMVVDSLKGGQFMFSFYPDKRWLQSSLYINCQPRQVAGLLSASDG